MASRSGIVKKAYIDNIDTLELQEKWGVITGLTRRAVVCGINGTTYATMYLALADAGVPGKGTYLDAANPQLLLTDRNVKMIDKDKAEVLLVYGQFNDRGQSLFYDGVVLDRNVAGKMDTTVAQKETNLYKPEGVGGRIPIILTHTYPTTDADYGGQTVQQTGMVQVQIPQSTFTIEGIKQVVAPWEMERRLTRSLNNATWLSRPAGTWMCTGVTWEFRAYANYFMTFTFQYEEDGWDPTAVFIDDRTSRPPEGLVEGEGIQTIPYYRRVNFTNELGFFVIGQ